MKIAQVFVATVDKRGDIGGLGKGVYITFDGRDM